MIFFKIFLSLSFPFLLVVCAVLVVLTSTTKTTTVLVYKYGTRRWYHPCCTNNVVEVYGRVHPKPQIFSDNFLTLKTKGQQQAREDVSSSFFLIIIMIEAAFQ